MPHSRHRPQNNGDGESEFDSDAVDEAAPDDEHRSVGDLEPDDDLTVLRLGPPERSLQVRRERAEHLPVNVIDDGDEKEQPANVPAQMFDLRYCGGSRGAHSRSLLFHHTSGLLTLIAAMAAHDQSARSIMQAR